MPRYWLLGRPGLMKLLAILHEHGPMPIHSVPRHGMGVATAYKSAELAARLGLARRYRCGQTLCIELTDAGRQVAEKLVEAIDALLTPAEPKAEARDHARGVQV